MGLPVVSGRSSTMTMFAVDGLPSVAPADGFRERDGGRLSTFDEGVFGDQHGERLRGNAGPECKFAESSRVIGAIGSRQIRGCVVNRYCPGGVAATNSLLPRCRHSFPVRRNWTG